MIAHAFHPSFRRRNLAPVTALFLLSLVAFFGLAAGTAQTEEKEGREVGDKIPKRLPIKVKVKNPEKVNDLNNDRWLGDLEIEVKNTGDKPIYFLRLILIFEDVKRDSGGQIGYQLVYGREQLIDIDVRAEPTDIPISPGGTRLQAT